MEITTCKTDLIDRYRSMYGQRAATNPQAFTLGFWRDHFATRTICESPDIHGRVLDLGCGTGEIGIWLAREKPDCRVYGVDICPDALVAARRHMLDEDPSAQERVAFVQSSGEELPFPDSEFDCCFLSHTLEHLERPSAAFRELYRVLKPGAPVLVIVPFGHHYDDPTHVWHFDEDGLARQLCLFGEDVSVRRSPDGSQLVGRLVLWRKPRIICMMRIKNEEQWIASVLQSASPLVDGFVILDDGSTDDTPRICRSHPRVIRYEYQQEYVTDEARDKNRLLRWALQTDPDWLLALDGDEILEDAAAITVRREINASPAEVTALGFEWLYMWDAHDRYRCDGQYRNFRQLRLFRVKGLPVDPWSLEYRSTKHGANFHCGSIPSNLSGLRRLIDVKVKHCGYFERSHREEKRVFYERLDPQAAAAGFYNHLTDERGMILMPWCERDVADVFYSDHDPKPMVERLRQRGNQWPAIGLFCLPGVKTNLIIGDDPGLMLTGLELVDVTWVRRSSGPSAPWVASRQVVREGAPLAALRQLIESGQTFDSVVVSDWDWSLPETELSVILEQADSLAARLVMLAFGTGEGGPGRGAVRPGGGIPYLKRLGSQGYDVVRMTDATGNQEACIAVKLVRHTDRELMSGLQKRYLASGTAGDSHREGGMAARVDPEATTKLSRYHCFARPEVQELVSPNARCILDVGCGAGSLGRSLKERQPCEVWGIEIIPEVAEAARQVLDRVYVGDAAAVIPALPNGCFDCIILADVLEHLVEPAKVLSALVGKLAPRGRLVISVPNVRHWSVIRGVLEGRWEYQDAGSLDRTHLRFFTRQSFEQLLHSVGCKPVHANATTVSGEKMPAGIVEACKAAGLDVGTLDLESQVYQFLYVAEPLAATALTSVIILAYNALSHTQRCLASIERHTPQAHELIIVDNGSTDGTVEYLPEYVKEHENVRVIANASNRGFAAGNNQAMAAARGEYIVLVNNDTVVTEGWLGRMLTVFERHPEVGLVGPVSNYVSGPQLVPNAKYADMQQMQRFARRWAKQHDGRLEETPRLVGFCLAMRRGVVDRIGGLDERFGSGNFEDDDFCLRALAAGFKAAIAKDVFIHHTGSQTFKEAKIDYRANMERNWRLFKDKWGIRPDLPVGQPCSITVQAGDLSKHYVPLPDLAADHEPDEQRRWWRDLPDRRLAETQEAAARMLTEAERAQAGGHWQAAVQSWQGALELSAVAGAQKAELLNSLGYCQFMAGCVAEAESSFLKGLELARNDLDLLHNLAELYLGQGEFNPATEYIKRALAVSPNDVGVLLSLGNCSAQLGEFETALMAFKRVRELAPETEGIEQLVKQCAQLAEGELGGGEGSSENVRAEPVMVLGG